MHGCDLLAKGLPQSAGNGGRTYTSMPAGAQSLSWRRPWFCSVRNATHPGTPDTATSTTGPLPLMLNIACTARTNSCEISVC